MNVRDVEKIDLAVRIELLGFVAFTCNFVPKSCDFVPSIVYDTVDIALHVRLLGIDLWISY